MAETLPVWYIGEHNSKRPLPVSAELVNHTQDLGVHEFLSLEPGL